MKTFIITLLFFSFSLLSYGQSSLPQGEKQWNAGVGRSTYGIPIYAGIDYGLRHNITLGGETSFHWDGPGVRLGMFGIAANANYHFNRLIGIPEEWDAYIGLNTGLYSIRWSKETTAVIGVGGHIGGRYFFDEKTGINLEFGTGGTDLAGVKLGITSRIIPESRKKSKKKKSTSSE